MAMQIVAFVLATLGIIDVAWFKRKGGYPTFYTMHSWIGLITYSIFALQLLIGLVFFWKPKLFLCFLPDHDNAIRRVLPWHILAGLAIYLGTIVSIVSGINNRQALFGASFAPESVNPQDNAYTIGNLVGVSMVIAGLSVYYHHKSKRRFVIDDGEYHTLVDDDGA
jgi:transmembrane ascorbate-dependent reductase